MKLRAVIFDLFGTLVPSFSLPEYQEILRKMSVVLEIPAKDFLTLWEETFGQSVLGIIPGIEVKLDRIGYKIGVTFNPARVTEAAVIMNEYSSRCMRPRPEAVSVLSKLKRQGFKLGLISDATYDAPELWKKTPLAPLIEVTVFSCEVGLRKPDPRIYLIATKRLCVEPGECFYIGDGSSSELTGASAVGMQAAQLFIPGEKDTYRVDPDQWDGKKISSLHQVLDLVKRQH